MQHLLKDSSDLTQQPGRQQQVQQGGGAYRLPSRNADTRRGDGNKHEQAATGRRNQCSTYKQASRHEKQAVQGKPGARASTASSTKAMHNALGHNRHAAG
jgi:hypothetical protein